MSSDRETLEKARGVRKVWGNLKSGKPLFANARNSRHRSFTPAEHKEAAKMHHTEAKYLGAKYPKFRTNDGGKRIVTAVRAHLAAMQTHKQLASEKAGKSEAFRATTPEEYLAKGDKRTLRDDALSDRNFTDKLRDDHFSDYFSGDKNKRFGAVKAAASRIKAKYPEVSKESHSKLGAKHAELANAASRKGHEVAAQGHLIRGSAHEHIAGKYQGEQRRVDKSRSEDLALHGGELVVKSDMAERIVSLCKSKQAGALSAR